jgi:hypothetical protein
MTSPLAQPVDRRQLLKAAGAVGAGALAGLAPVTAFAGRAESSSHGIEGSWLVTVTVSSPGPPPFTSLWSFASGGVFIATDAIDRLPQFSASPEHGAWLAENDREVSVAGMKLRFDPAGNFVGTFKARGRATLDRDGDRFVGSARAELLDLSGTPFFSARVAFQGTRIRS